MRAKELTNSHRLDIVLRKVSGCSTASLASQYDVSYDTMYKWVHSQWFGRILQKLIDLAKSQPSETWDL